MKIRIITSIISCIALFSCSTDDAENVYDDVLSNTNWHLFYTDVPTTATVDEEFVLPNEILDRLQSENRTEQETDTINKINRENGRVPALFWGR